MQWLYRLYKGTNLMYENFWSVWTLKKRCGVCCAIHQKHTPIQRHFKLAYHLTRLSTIQKQASLMFSVSAKRIFSKDGLTLTRTFSYLNPNAVDAYYVHLSLSSILLCTCRIAIAVPFLCLSKKKKKKTE